MIIHSYKTKSWIVFFNITVMSKESNKFISTITYEPISSQHENNFHTSPSGSNLVIASEKHQYTSNHV